MARPFPLAGTVPARPYPRPAHVPHPGATVGPVLVPASWAQQDETVLLVWRSGEHYDHFNDLPCVICRRPTPLRSHADEPAHKVCAEWWNTHHPGTRRFYSDDTPSKRHTTHEQPKPGTAATEPWAGETLFDPA